MVKCSQCLKMQRCFDCPLWFLGKVQVICWQIQLLSTQSQWNLTSRAWHKNWEGQSNLRLDGTSTLQRFTRYKKQHNHINPLCPPHIMWWIKVKILLTLITLPSCSILPNWSFNLHVPKQRLCSHTAHPFSKPGWNLRGPDYFLSLPGVYCRDLASTFKNYKAITINTLNKLCVSVGLGHYYSLILS